MRALITGGAGDIAAELAHRLADRGYRLVLVDFDEPRLQRVAATLPSAESVVCDLSNALEVRDLATRFESDFADLDLFVNNAGIVHPGDLTDITAEQLEQQLQVNLVAAALLTQAAGRAMVTRGRGGAILSLVSLGGIIALPGSAAYSATKFGLRGLLTALHHELRPAGIRVVSVFPNGVDSAMLRHEAAHGGTPLTFLGQVLTPAQVADACLQALDSGRMETYLPYSDSLTTRLVAAWPWVLRPVLPVLMKLGERGKRRYRTERGI